MLCQLHSFQMKVKAKCKNIKVSNKLLVITCFHSSRICHLLESSSGLWSGQWYLWAMQ